MPPFALTDVWRLRGTLGQEGCEDNEIQDVETKAQRKCEEGNAADCTSDEEEEGEGRSDGSERNRSGIKMKLKDVHPLMSYVKFKGAVQIYLPCLVKVEEADRSG